MKKNMKFSLVVSPNKKWDGILIVVPADEKEKPDTAALKDHPLFRSLAKDDQRYLFEVMTNEQSWGEKSSRVLPLPSNPAVRFVLLGRGYKKEGEGVPKRSFALKARQAITILKEAKVSHGAVALKDFVPYGGELSDALRFFVINAQMADFAFTKYKTPPKEGWPKIDALDILADRNTKALADALREGIIIGEEVNHCRILANTPGGDMTPQKLAQAAVTEKKRWGRKLTVRVLDVQKMKQLGMGGVLGVGRGSADPPRFIIMEYWGSSKTDRPIVFCGKGVTFDTGGLNLKPETAILEMHMDMSGGAAVIHAISAIARLQLPVNVVGLVPAVENMPSGSSYHPGDVLKTITGKTIEVLNTDAEGRIILADALGYAQRYKPKLIIDVATLTGAAMVAVGQRMIALMTQDPKLETLARQIGEDSGDDVWPLPLWDEYAEDIQGTFGDVANMGKTRYGGAITGAMFLRQFVGDYPWMHLDIAPTMTTIEGQYLAKGASGTAVRFLVELARHYARGER
jgi:leucyl aminopeptidase